MGWWDDGIMGGDAPWDAAGVANDLLERAGDEPFERYHMPDSWDDADRALMRARFDRAGGFGPVCDRLLGEFGDDDAEVAVQVLGLMALSCGAPLSAGDRARVVAACAADGWARDDEGRRAKVAALAEAVRSYEDGRPATIRQDGLFDKIDAALGG